MSPPYIQQLCMPTCNHEKLQQIMPGPTTNHVIPCNTDLYHHTMLQLICIAFFQIYYQLCVACFTDNSHMYQPCTITDMPQPSFTTTNTKHPIVSLLQQINNISSQHHYDLSHNQGAITSLSQPTLFLNIKSLKPYTRVSIMHQGQTFNTQPYVITIHTSIMYANM